MKISFRVWLLFIGAMLIGFVLPVGAQTDSGRALFSAAVGAPRDLAALQHLGLERVNTVSVNFGVLNEARVSLGYGRVFNDSGLILNLFDDVAFVALNTRLEARTLGEGIIWYGTIPAVAYSNVILIISDESLNGYVITPQKTYYIEPAGAGLHRILQVNPAAASLRNTEDGIGVPTAAMPRAAPSQAGTRADTGALVDVLVVYTPSAEAYFGGTAQTLLAIEGMNALTNQSYADSQVNHRLRVVHTARINYTEAPNMETDLNQLTLFDGVIDEVHFLRDAYAADLVMMILGTPPQIASYCGLAWVPPGNMPQYGFATMQADCRGTVAYPHELGHTMGVTHDPVNAGGVAPWMSYGYGYQDTSTGAGDYGDFVTIMAYGRGGQCPPNNPLSDIGQGTYCPHILRWSSPNQTFNGRVLGTVTQNNVMALNATAYTVANFRVSAQAMTQLSTNGSFEQAADVSIVPQDWTMTVNSNKDRRSCNNGKAYDGVCSLRFIGQPLENSRAVQFITPNSPILAGDTLHFQGYIKREGTNRNSIIDLQVRFTDGTVKRYKIVALPGWYDYQWVRHPDIVLPKDVELIKFRVMFTSTTGRLFADHLGLFVTRTSAPLGLP